MQRLEVSGAVRPIYGSLGVKQLRQRYTCQGDMFRPNRSSSGPSRTQIQALFSFTAVWDPISAYRFQLQSKKVNKFVQVELAVCHTASSTCTNLFTFLLCN